MTKQLRDLVEEQNPVVKILGWDDDICECMHCGRNDLKGTLICEHANGTIAHLGSVCGVHAYRWGKSLEKREEAKYARHLEKMAQDADYQRKEQARADFNNHRDCQEARCLINQLNAIEPPIRFAERKIHPDWIRAHELKVRAAEETNAKYEQWGIKVWGA